MSPWLYQQSGKLIALLFIPFSNNIFGLYLFHFICYVLLLRNFNKNSSS